MFSADSHVEVSNKLFSFIRSRFLISDYILSMTPDQLDILEGEIFGLTEYQGIKYDAKLKLSASHKFIPQLQGKIESFERLRDSFRLVPGKYYEHEVIYIYCNYQSSDEWSLVQNTLDI